MGKRNKLDRFDGRRLMEALDTLEKVRDYNYVPSTPLYRKLDTVCRKLGTVLETELSEELQYEYKILGRL